MAASFKTDEGKKAYELAGQIAETRAIHRWNELMAIYEGAATPEARVEVIRLAASLAQVSKILEWQLEVNAKANDLKAQGHL